MKLCNLAIHAAAMLAGAGMMLALLTTWDRLSANYTECGGWTACPAVPALTIAEAR